jgi:mycothiol synthase
MITVRPAETDADLEAWRRIRIAVLPNERAASVEEMRRTATPDRLMLLAELDGDVIGAAIGGKSDLAGSGFLAPRVLERVRRRGVGTALLRALAEHVHGLGYDQAGANVDDPGSLARPFRTWLSIGRSRRHPRSGRTSGSRTRRRRSLRLRAAR